MSGNVREAVTEILGRDIMGVFDCMEIAEEEIAKRTEPEAQNAFGVLRPTEVLRGKATQVYRGHVAELIERVIAGEDTRPGTKAECLCAMMATATQAPLNAEGAALTEWLFGEVMPEHHELLDGLGAAREKWEGQIAESFAEAQRELRDETRVPKVKP